MGKGQVSQICCSFKHGSWSAGTGGKCGREVMGLVRYEPFGYEPSNRMIANGEKGTWEIKRGVSKDLE